MFPVLVDLLMFYACVCVCFFFLAFYVVVNSLSVYSVCVGCHSWRNKLYQH